MNTKWEKKIYLENRIKTLRQGNKQLVKTVEKLYELHTVGGFHPSRCGTKYSRLDQVKFVEGSL